MLPDLPVGRLCRALLTPFTLADSPIGFTVPFVNLHRLCAVIFAVVTYVAMITLLLARRRTYGRIYTAFVAVLLAVGGLNVYGILPSPPSFPP